MFWKISVSIDVNTYSIIVTKYMIMIFMWFTSEYKRTYFVCCILAISYLDDGHRSDRNILVKNNGHVVDRNILVNNNGHVIDRNILVKNNGHVIDRNILVKNSGHVVDRTFW